MKNKLYNTISAIKKSSGTMINISLVISSSIFTLICLYLCYALLFGQEISNLLKYMLSFFSFVFFIFGFVITFQVTIDSIEEILGKND